MAAIAHPVDTLPELARTLIVESGAPDPGRLRLAQLRSKPGRGVVALVAPQAGPRMWLRLDAGGASLEAEGADAALPALDAALAPQPGSSPWIELERAARLLTGDPLARLTAADATVVRHKPGSRCVLRYALTVTSAGRHRRVAVFGKLFAAVADAASADAVLSALHGEQAAAGRVTVPRPLGVAGSLGLALAAAVGEEGRPPIPGTAMLRCNSGAVPVDALAAAARALAALHRSAVRPQGEQRDAAAVAKRVALLAGHAPWLATRLRAAGDELARVLAAGAVPTAPVHGGFKPSQLVYTSARRVTVTDFDGFRLGEPALDVGYFLAYLRPSSLWRGTAASRAWFEAAAAAFTTAYARSMLEAGRSADEVAGTLRRAPLHEAAALLKIAGRRPHRCNAPRPAELAAMLREIEGRIALAGSSADSVSSHQQRRASSSPSPIRH